MPPRSLVDICLSVAIENIHLITSLENLPQFARKRILDSMKSVQQLKDLEREDPLLYHETGPQWQRLIQSRFPHLIRKGINLTPKVADKWSDVFDEYETLDKVEIAKATAIISQSFAKLDQKKTTNFISFGASKLLDQNISNSGTRRKAVSATPSRTKDKVLSTARKEATTFSKFRQPPPPARQSKVLKAPDNMVEAKRIEKQPMHKPKMIRPVRKHSTAVGPMLPTKDKAARDREARLLAIKNGSKGPVAKETSGDEDERKDQEKQGGKRKRTDEDEEEISDEANSTQPCLKRKRGGLLSNARGANAPVVRVGRPVLTSAAAPIAAVSASNTWSPASSPPTSSPPASSPATPVSNARSLATNPPVSSPPASIVGTPAQIVTSPASIGASPAPVAVAPASIAGVPGQVKLSPADQARLAALRKKKVTCMRPAVRPKKF